MIFTATLADRGLRGHFLLQDVECENGMKRQHCWLNQSYASLPSFPIPSRIRIEGKYRRYRPGPNGWTISKVYAAEVV
jgi:hypothetical protein